jgi:CO/xanthine dehydrogenase FAD-binding subunit
MTQFTYHRPDGLAAAFELLSAEGAVALSGGTDLLVAIRHRKSRPRVVVDLKTVGEIGDEVSNDGENVWIGGRVVMRQIVEDPNLVSQFPALVAAARVVGSVQIRNRATLAGNLCNASPAADTAPPLIAYSAVAAVAGPDGARVVPVDELFIGPGKTVLGPGEVVTSIGLPLPERPVGSAFARVARRRGVDLASVNLACVVDDSGRVRFGIGAMGPTPLSVDSTIHDLESDDGWRRLLSVATPISDVRASARYRSAMLEVHSRRALGKAVEILRTAT